MVDEGAHVRIQEPVVAREEADALDRLQAIEKAHVRERERVTREEGGRSRARRRARCLDAQPALVRAHPLGVVAGLAPAVPAAAAADTARAAARAPRTARDLADDARDERGVKQGVVHLLHADARRRPLRRGLHHQDLRRRCGPAARGRGPGRPRPNFGPLPLAHPRGGRGAQYEQRNAQDLRGSKEALEYQ